MIFYENYFPITKFFWWNFIRDRPHFHVFSLIHTNEQPTQDGANVGSIHKINDSSHFLYISGRLQMMHFSQIPKVGLSGMRSTEDKLDATDIPIILLSHTHVHKRQRHNQQISSFVQTCHKQWLTAAEEEWEIFFRHGHTWRGHQGTFCVAQ